MTTKTYTDMEKFKREKKVCQFAPDTAVYGAK